MFCANCRQTIPDNARFCSKCGAQVEQVRGEPAAEALHRASGGAAAMAAAGPGTFAGTGPLPGMLERVRNILLRPREEWPLIEGESTSMGQLYRGYVVPLAAFAAIVSILRMGVIGVSLPFGGSLRAPMTTALTYGLVTFAFGLLGLFLVGVLINALAPTFRGLKDQRQAVKTAAYAFTPAWLGTALTFLPLGRLLQFLAGIYGIYLLYLGLPVLMRSDRNRAGSYTAAVVVCTILLGIAFGVLSATLGGASRLGGFGAGLRGAESPEMAADRGAAVLGNVLGGALGTDEKGKAGLSAALANLAKSGQQMEQQSRTDHTASTQGTSASASPSAASAPAGTTNSPGAEQTAQSTMAAAGGLLTAMGGALGGSHRVEPVDFNTLKSLLPDSLPQLRRTGAEGSSQQALGVKSTSASAEYQGEAGAHVHIKITDISGVSGLMEAASGLVPTTESASDTGYEKNVVIDGRPVHEKFDRRSGEAEADVIVAKRFEVDVTGHEVDMAQLETLLGKVDLARLESMQGAGAVRE